MKQPKSYFWVHVLACGIWLGSCSDPVPKVAFPSHIYLVQPSTDKKTQAIIYSWSTEEDNFLGSDDRFLLGFSNEETKWYIDKELSEGMGTYEGGLLALEWLNDHEVLIKRMISDRTKDIKYNLRLNQWTLLTPSENE